MAGARLTFVDGALQKVAKKAVGKGIEEGQKLADCGCCSKPGPCGCCGGVTEDASIHNTGFFLNGNTVERGSNVIIYGNGATVTHSGGGVANGGGAGAGAGAGAGKGGATGGGGTGGSGGASKGGSGTGGTGKGGGGAAGGKGGVFIYLSVLIIRLFGQRTPCARLRHLID